MRTQVTFVERAKPYLEEMLKAKGERELSWRSPSYKAEIVARIIRDGIRISNKIGNQYAILHSQYKICTSSADPMMVTARIRPQGLLVTPTATTVDINQPQICTRERNFSDVLTTLLLNPQYEKLSAIHFPNVDIITENAEVIKGFNSWCEDNGWRYEPSASSGIVIKKLFSPTSTFESGD